jgi:hypothetical protein
MTTSATDLGGEKKLSTVEVPHLETLEELDAHFEHTYGPDVLRTLKDSNLDQAAMVEELHKYGLNGRSEAVEHTYRLHQQEFARKETLLGTTWRWTKNAAGFATDVVTAPFRWTWESFKQRPVVTTIAVLALAAAAIGGAYYLAGDIEGLFSKLGLSHLYGGLGADKAAEVLGGAANGGADQLPNMYGGETGGALP